MDKLLIQLKIMIKDMPLLFGGVLGVLLGIPFSLAIIYLIDFAKDRA